MSANIQYDPATEICELHIRGTLKRDEFTSCENELAAAISAGSKPRLLVVCDHFGGWERGEDWNNLDFMFTHGNKIVKIAIVGAGTKEEELKAFTGAGMRPTPVKFFPTDGLPDAETWLLE